MFTNKEQLCQSFWKSVKEQKFKAKSIERGADQFDPPPPKLLGFSKFVYVPVRPTIQAYPQSTVVVENDTVSLFCKATGKPAPIVTWIQVNKPGRSFPPGGTLTISRVNVNDTGEYNCTASNSVGSAMASATVTVKRKYASLKDLKL